MKNSNDTIGNRTCDLPVCSAVLQPIAPPRASILTCIAAKFSNYLLPDRPQCNDYYSTLHNLTRLTIDITLGSSDPFSPLKPEVYTSMSQEKRNGKFEYRRKLPCLQSCKKGPSAVWCVKTLRRMTLYNLGSNFHMVYLTNIEIF